MPRSRKPHAAAQVLTAQFWVQARAYKLLGRMGQLLAVQDASGQPARIPVDSTAVTAHFPGAITELQLSRDGTRSTNNIILG